MNPSTRKVALVTGASKGIGRAIARELASGNYRLALSGRDKQSLYSESRHAMMGWTKTLAKEML